MAVRNSPTRSSDAGARARRRVSIVVWAALAANVAIAISKFAAAKISGSSALLSEAIHSTADSGNELLLVLGSALSRKPADEFHPFGRGREIYFWGLIVALVLFGVGGGLSFYKGIDQVLHPRAIDHVFWNYVVLGCAFVFESSSFTLAVRTMRRSARRHAKPFLEAVHDSKDPEHFVVLFEDAAAIVGVIVAFAGVYFSTTLHAPVLDGVASIVIGCVLTAAALVLAYECRSLLLGEAADRKKIEAIQKLAAEDPAVDRVGDALTMYLGPDELLLNLTIAFEDNLTAGQIERAVARLEQAIRERHPEVHWIFIEASSLRPNASSRGEALDPDPARHPSDE